MLLLLLISISLEARQEHSYLPIGRTIASRTIASGVPEKSADFWGALQIVAIVVNFISRVSVFIRAIRGGSRSVGAIRVSFLPLADA
jgi:hypothetical protein